MHIIMPLSRRDHLRIYTRQKWLIFIYTKGLPQRGEASTFSTLLLTFKMTINKSAFFLQILTNTNLRQFFSAITKISSFLKKILLIFQYFPHPTPPHPCRIETDSRHATFARESCICDSQSEQRINTNTSNTRGNNIVS